MSRYHPARRNRVEMRLLPMVERRIAKPKLPGTARGVGRRWHRMTRE